MADFTGPTPAPKPPIKDKAKFVKKVKVPKSASYDSSSEGDWGKGK